MSEAYFRSILNRPERARTMPYDFVPSSPPSGRYHSWAVAHIPPSNNSVAVQATRQRTQSEPLKHFHLTPLFASKKTLDMKAALNISSTDALNIPAYALNQEKAHKMGLEYLSHVYEDINTKIATDTYLNKDDDLCLLKEKIIFWNNKLQELITGRGNIDKNILEIMINIEKIIDSSTSNDIYFYENRNFNTIKNIIKNYLHKLEGASLDALYDVYLNQYKLKLTYSKRFLYLENEEIIQGNKTYTSLISMFKATEDSINKNTGCPLHTIPIQLSMPIPMPGINAGHIEQKSMDLISELACRLEEDEAMIAGYGTPPAEGSGRLYAMHILTNIFNLLNDLSCNKQGPLG